MCGFAWPLVQGRVALQAGYKPYLTFAWPLVRGRLDQHAGSTPPSVTVLKRRRAPSLRACHLLSPITRANLKWAMCACKGWQAGTLPFVKEGLKLEGGYMPVHCHPSLTFSAQAPPRALQSSTGNVHFCVLSVPHCNSKLCAVACRCSPVTTLPLVRPADSCNVATRPRLCHACSTVRKPHSARPCQPHCANPQPAVPHCNAELQRLCAGACQ
jgi:hypothetical protein